MAKTDKSAQALIEGYGILGEDVEIKSNTGRTLKDLPDMIKQKLYYHNITKGENRDKLYNSITYDDFFSVVYEEVIARGYITYQAIDWAILNAKRDYFKPKYNIINNNSDKVETTICSDFSVDIDRLEDWLSLLPNEFEREVLRLYFRDGLTLDTIAEMLGTYYSKIQKAHKRALEKLKNLIIKNNLL